MGRIFLVELEGRYFKCRFCGTHLALSGDILSRSFNCREGKAYLFSKVVNITLGGPDDRLMLSGTHTVVDIFCCGCGQYIGWKYVHAYDKNQKYKEGKFVLERWRTCEEIVDVDDISLDARPRSSEMDIS